jgi:hypothetical protein
VLRHFVQRFDFQNNLGMPRDALGRFGAQFVVIAPVRLAR